MRAFDLGEFFQNVYQTKILLETFCSKVLFDMCGKAPASYKLNSYLGQTNFD